MKIQSKHLNKETIHLKVKWNVEREFSNYIQKSYQKYQEISERSQKDDRDIAIFFVCLLYVRNNRYVWRIFLLLSFSLQIYEQHCMFLFSVPLPFWRKGKNCWRNPILKWKKPGIGFLTSFFMRTFFCVINFPKMSLKKIS